MGLKPAEHAEPCGGPDEAWGTSHTDRATGRRPKRKSNMKVLITGRAVAR